MKNLEKLVAPFRVTKGKGFELDAFPTDGKKVLKIDRDEAEAILAAGIERLQALQEALYAENRWSVLLIFQAMDAAGKDSTIKKVMSGVNPQGCQVFSFKAPSDEELDHDYLWRCTRRLPERGRIGIFNRSYYEEVLVVRVNPDFLDAQNLPKKLVTKNIWRQRFMDIRNFESYMARQGTLILKFFLNVSKEKQKERFLERLDLPEKHWKFSSHDLRTRADWPHYMKAYEEMIATTSATHAPWHVVPADRKWLTRAIVVSAIVEAMERLDSQYPSVEDEDVAKFEEYRRALLAD